nr:hypothetical protein [Tanacetum cinerariifolium]
MSLTFADTHNMVAYLNKSDASEGFDQIIDFLNGSYIKLYHPEPKPMKKKQQVEMDEEYARKLHEELNKYIDWDVAIDHVKQKAKEDPYVQRYQVMKKRPQTEAQARRNMIIEDLESLWSLVKERFSTSQPNNFSDDYLLTIFGAMFERPDGQAQVWKSQRSVHGQAKVKSWKLLESCGVHIITFTTTQLILLVERRYPLSSFGVDAVMVNTTNDMLMLSKTSAAIGIRMKK